MSIERHIPPAKVAIIEVIYLTAMRGDGTAGDPERPVYYYYSVSGELLACFDSIMQNPDFTPPVAAGMQSGDLKNYRGS